MGIDELEEKRNEYKKYVCAKMCNKKNKDKTCVVCQAQKYCNRRMKEK